MYPFLFCCKRIIPYILWFVNTFFQDIVSRSQLPFVQNFHLFPLKKGKKSLGRPSQKVRFCRLFGLFPNLCFRKPYPPIPLSPPKFLSILYKTLYARHHSKTVKCLLRTNLCLFLPYPRKSENVIIYKKEENPNPKEIHRCKRKSLPYSHTTFQIGT